MSDTNSDPMANAEIEDVLSSIRRLVSEDSRAPKRPPAAPEAAGKVAEPAAADRLVLTPALRVPDAGAPAPVEPPLPEAEGQETIPHSPAAPEGGASLEATIVELEEAVTGIGGEFESEADEELQQLAAAAFGPADADDPPETSEPDADLSSFAETEEEDTAGVDSQAEELPDPDPDPDPETMTELPETETEDPHPEEDRDLALAGDSDDRTAGPGWLVAEPEAGADVSDTDTDTEMVAGDEEMPAAADIEAPGWLGAAPATGAGRIWAETQERTATPQAEPSGNVDEDAAVIDEATLHRLVAEILRQELQGPLGERITRNVRKLVRREIYRVLSDIDNE